VAPDVTGALLSGALLNALLTVASLALLYLPAALLAATLLEPLGSFGVVVRREYGSLAACAGMAWTAAHLPVLALAVSGLAGPLSGVLLWPALGVCGFSLLMVFALRAVLGARALTAVVAALAAALALLLRPLLMLLASPFALYLVWLYLRGDIRDIEWSLGSRRAFKRHLEALTLNPRDAEAHYQLGLVHLRRRQHAEAAERFRKALEIDGRELDAHHQLGRLLREQGQHAEALRHFEQVLLQNPAHASHEGWREAGATYVDAGDFAQARMPLERFVEQRPYDAEGLYLLGRVRLELGEREAARELLRRCVEAAETAPSFRRREVRRWAQLAARLLGPLSGRSEG
jgi:tetratricopeptide (TPR) repeat protein